MLKWLLGLLFLAAGIGCLSALGVGMKALGDLVLALVVMSCISLLIAWPFLRKPPTP